MGLFGNDSEQDRRLDEIEQHVQDLDERLRSLSAGLDDARTELSETTAVARGALQREDIDETFTHLNDDLLDARRRTENARAASDAAWARLGRQR